MRIIIVALTMTIFLGYLLSLPAHAADTTSKKKAKKVAADDRSLKAVEKNIVNGKRVALVIGNGNYRYPDSMPKLANPAHDAEDIAKALRGFGFEVIEKKNQTKEGMDEAIAEFGRKIGNSEAALFYFAGHGLQVKGQNYLVPVDARIESEAQIPYKSVNLNQLLEEMDNGKSRANIVMLDACRNNPISGKFRSGATRGLAAPASQPKGTVIVYATDPGGVAADGTGRNGLFTAGLLSGFKGSDLSLHGVLVRASEAVEQGSGQKQTPYINGPLSLQKSFQFAAGQTVQTASLEPASATKPQQPEPAEQAQRTSDSLDDIVAKAEAEERAKQERLEQLKADIVKYERIVASPRGAELKPVAWKALAANYPEAASTTQYDTVAFLATQGVAMDNGSIITLEQKRKKDEELLAGEFVSVPAGCFSANGKNVCLDAFRIGKYSVMQGQYKRIMGSNPSLFSGCGDNCPVEQVSWNDAQNFISKLNSQSGGHYRLPTEAEWEYACRSGGKQEEYCGGNNIDAIAWYKDNSAGKTHPVGQKQPNGLGIYDMAGNVWQWVQDWYGDNYPSSGRNPTGASSSTWRAIRGGDRENPAEHVRAAIRNGLSPDTRANGVGFRLVSPVQ